MGHKAVMIQGADTTANSGAQANSLIISTTPGRLYSLTVFNNGAAQFIQLFDSATVPVDGTVPKLSMSVAGGQAGSFDFGDGRIFLTGIVACNSSTGPTKTIGAANVIFDATWRAWPA